MKIFLRPFLLFPLIQEEQLSFTRLNYFFGVAVQVQHKPGCTTTESGYIGLKFQILEVEGFYCTIYVAKTKSLISCTVQLMCVFVFAYAKSKLSHDVAHLETKSSHIAFIEKYYHSMLVQEGPSSCQSLRKISAGEGCFHIAISFPACAVQLVNSQLLYIHKSWISLTSYDSVES